MAVVTAPVHTPGQVLHDQQWVPVVAQELGGNWNPSEWEKLGQRGVRGCSWCSLGIQLYAHRMHPRLCFACSLSVDFWTGASIQSSQNLVHNQYLTFKIPSFLPVECWELYFIYEHSFSTMLTKVSVQVTASVYHTGRQFRNFKYVTSSVPSKQQCQNKWD